MHLLLLILISCDLARAHTSGIVLCAGPPSSYLGQGLAARKHPRSAMLDSRLPGAAAGAAVVKQAEPMKVANSLLADMPGADLPPVIAPARCLPLLSSHSPCKAAALLPSLHMNTS